MLKFTVRFFVKTSGSQGLGKTYADAKRNRSANGQREFEVEPVATYGSTAVGGRVFRRVKAGAHTDILIDELKEAIEGLRQTAKDEFGRFVFGDGTGVLATVDAAPVSRDAFVSDLLDTLESLVSQPASPATLALVVN